MPGHVSPIHREIWLRNSERRRWHGFSSMSELWDAESDQTLGRPPPPDFGSSLAPPPPLLDPDGLSAPHCPARVCARAHVAWGAGTSFPSRRHTQGYPPVAAAFCPCGAALRLVPRGQRWGRCPGDVAGGSTEEAEAPECTGLRRQPGRTERRHPSGASMGQASVGAPTGGGGGSEG